MNARTDGPKSHTPFLFVHTQDDDNLLPANSDQLVNRPDTPTDTERGRGDHTYRARATEARSWAYLRPEPTSLGRTALESSESRIMPSMLLYSRRDTYAPISAMLFT
jgi:hypothetical protein